MAFFPASSSYPGMLGELYSAAFTAPAFNWICSPAITELETIVMDWLAKILNLPACYLSSGEGGGVIQGSASEAVVTVMVAARDKYLQETTAHLVGEAQDDAIAFKRSKLVALGSESAHSSTQKAAQIAGVRFRSIPTSFEDGLALSGPALQQVLDECKAKGLEPFYLTVTLGTTPTCAVDDFASIASTLAKYTASLPNPSEVPGAGEVWVHVDAAFAGAALVCPEYQHYTAHFNHFHSFDMNMHKWLLTNFDASCLFIKRRKHLIDALSISRSYLQNSYTDKGLVTDYRDWQIPLGRRFRALKIWFVLRTYGVSGLRAHIRKHVQFGEFFHDLVLGRKDLFKVLTGPAFALTTVNVVPKEGDERDANALTKEVYEMIFKRGEVYLSSGVVNGVYAIRVVSANPLAEERFLRKVFDLLVDTTEEVLKNGGGKVVVVNGLVKEGKGEGIGEDGILGNGKVV